MLTERFIMEPKVLDMEVANSIVWRDGPSQGDLKKGSIESIASGTAITKRANDAGISAGSCRRSL